ncbi:14348_t:CDS:1, partial [Funneliformis geosporum]
KSEGCNAEGVTPKDLHNTKTQTSHCVNDKFIFSFGEVRNRIAVKL